METQKFKLVELIRNNKVKFDSYRQGFFYYNIESSFSTEDFLGAPVIDYITYQFTIPLEDIDGATLLNEDKALTYMRWIRKAIDNNTLIKINGKS